VYPKEEKNVVERNQILTTLWIDFTYKRRMFEVVLDMCLVSFAYWASYFLRYEGAGFSDYFPIFLDTLPVALAAQVLSYFAFGVYRGVWRYTSVADLITHFKAVTAGVVATIVVTVFLYRFDNFSRSVFVSFWGISLLFLAGSRLSFRMIAEMVRRNAVPDGKRVLIYGAGDKGEFALREIINNRKLGLTPVGFIDDDVKKHRRKIQGFKIFGGRDGLADLIPKYRINEVIVASGTIRPDNLKATCDICEQMGVTLRNLELSIKQMAVGKAGGNLPHVKRDGTAGRTYH
jgi:UDP-GlcNAc:undecaprenyl-phosphate GlcNAc-1-phosphate transferase